MKKLSTEQKAKAYEEAVINGSRLWECGEITRENYEYIFPELKENEDEKVRQELISFFTERAKHTEDSTFNGLSSKEIISWLEKQGENKPVIEMKSAEESLGIDSDTYNKIVDECVYGKQKLADKVEPKKIKKAKFKTGDRIIGIVSGMQYYITEICDDYYRTESGCIIMFCAQDNFELYKQKPAWSEEDEKCINELIKFFDYLTKCIATEERHQENRRWLNFLESLKDRVNPQLKQEWSEEDEYRIKDAIYFLDTAKKHYASTVELDACINWLKSLRPQNTWKPSDEQIKTLEFVVESIDNMLRAIGQIDNVTKPRLKEILVTLKELREK